MITEHKKQKIADKKERDNTRREFLLTFFKQTFDFYAEKEVNGFWLVKQWNGETKRWQVAIYTKESFKKYCDFIG